MAKLYYGNGNCSIEGSDIRGVHIKFKGAIKITDKTSDSFLISHRDNGLIIFPVGGGTLNDLFDYTGEFKVTFVEVSDNNAEKVSTSIHRVMDYTELLTTNAEDMTTISEDLSATYVSGKRVSKTTLDKPHMINQHTSKHDGELYLQDGTLYDGYFHIHLSDGGAMTDKDHTEYSQDLYFANGKPTRNKGKPYGVIEQNRRKKQKAKSKVSGKKKTPSNRSNY